jgi:hypothetical protein
MKRLLLTLTLCLALSSCADRTRQNCETTTANGIFERKCL